MGKGFGARKPKNGRLNRKDYYDFLLQILNKTTKSNGNRQVVYLVLEENLDKLDNNFAQLLRTWATTTLPTVAIDEKLAKTVAKIAHFSSLIQEFPLGSKASNLEIAIAGYEVIAPLFHRQALLKEWAITKNNLGAAYIYRIRGDRVDNLKKALAAYQDSLQVYTRKDFPEQWAGIQNNLGVVYRNWIGDDHSKKLELAISSYQAALQVYTPQTFPEQWAKTQNNLVAAYTDPNFSNRIEEVDRAIMHSELALQVCTSPEQWAEIQNNLDTVYYIAQNLEQAINCYKSALQIRTREKFPEGWAKSQNNLGNVYRDRQQIDEAVVCYQLALEVYTPTDFPLDCFKTGHNLGNTAFAAGRWHKAIEGYGFAINAVEKSRTWATSEFRRQKIFEELVIDYENIVQAYIYTNQLDKALEYVERSRSKRLLDLMASNKPYQDGKVPQKVKDLLEQYEELQRQIDQAYLNSNSDKNQGLTGVDNSSRAYLAAWKARNDEIAVLENKKKQIWEQLCTEDFLLAAGKQVSPPDFLGMQKLIDQPTTAILSFYTTTNNTYIFILRKEKTQPTLYTCPELGFETLHLWIFSNWLLPYLKNKDGWKSQTKPFLAQLSQSLHLNDLVAKLQKDGVKELVLVPHLYLHQIPFTALPTKDGKYLGEEFLIRYTPSCQVLEFCKQRGEVEGDLIYGTVEDAEDNLLYASFEGEQIAQMHQIPNHQRLIGSSQATCDNYRQLAEQVQVLHSCHHAESCLDNPLESVLKLRDGNITLGQLMTPGWRLPNLSDVFLSCCETGLGVTPITDDILTLSTGFLCAGARSVVSTLWTVDDLATALFSIFYHQYRKQGKSRPEALQQAQLDLQSLSGQELAAKYKSELTVFLQEKHKQVEVALKAAYAALKQLRKQPQSQLEGSLSKCEQTYSQASTAQREIKKAEVRLEEVCKKQFPFKHPFYWAAFTCSGLP